MRDFKVYQASGYLTKLVTDASDVRKEYEEISGSLVRFDTPISAPLVSLIVDINPVQDLHGQDSPYPAGGGINKFGGTVGTLFPLSLASGTSIVGSAELNGAEYGVVRVYDSNETFLQSFIIQTPVPGSSTRYQGGVTLTGDVSYIKIEGSLLTNVQIEITSAPDIPASPYEPYSNICPFTGLTGCEVWVKAEYDTSLPATVSVTFPDTFYGGKYDFISGGLKPYKEYDSYNGETLTGEWMSSMDKYVEGTTPTIGAQVIDLGSYDTTEQLIPQEINTLQGVNYIWADTGDVSVKYRIH